MEVGQKYEGLCPACSELSRIEKGSDSFNKGEYQKMTLFMTWARGRVEMSPVALLHIRPFLLERPHISGLESHQVRELGSTAKGGLPGRQAGRETALLRLSHRVSMWFSQHQSTRYS